MKTLAIVIPAYNEAPTIEKLLSSLPKKLLGVKQITTIVIDDGSADNTSIKAQNKASTVLRHPINLGVGCATGTGFAASLKSQADIVVTMDGDGQHSPGDLQNLINPIIDNSADVVFGNRMTNLINMPLSRRIGNRLLTLFTFITTGLAISDSQCGYRAYSAQAIKKMRLVQPGFEICSEIVAETKRNQLQFTQVPIKTIYDLKTKKSQNPLNAFNIILRMVERLLWS